MSRHFFFFFSGGVPPPVGSSSAVLLGSRGRCVRLLQLLLPRNEAGQVNVFFLQQARRYCMHPLPFHSFFFTPELYCSPSHRRTCVFSARPHTRQAGGVETMICDFSRKHERQVLASQAAYPTDVCFFLPSSLLSSRPALSLSARSLSPTLTPQEEEKTSGKPQEAATAGAPAPDA